MGVALGAWLLHVAAMALAPISVVQAVLSTGVVVLAVMAERMFGFEVGRRQWLGVAMTAAGLVLLVVTLPAHSGSHSSFSVAGMISFEAGMLAIGALLITGPRIGAPDHHHGVMLGAAAGVLFGVSDVAIKALTGLGGDGILAILLSPWLFVTIVASVVAFYASARGLQDGEAVPVIASTSTAANVSTIMGGIIVFGDPMPGDTLGIALQMFAFALVVVAALIVPPPLRAAEANARPPSSAERQAPEDRAREQLDDEHHPAQEPGHVDDPAAAAEALDDRRRDGGRVDGAGGGVHALGHLRADEARADDQHVDAGALERVAQAAGEGVRGGLGGAVGEVGDARAVGGHGGEQDDRAAALAAHRLGAQRQHRDRAGAVDRVQLGGVGELLVALAAEQAGGDDRDVDPLGPREDALDRGGVPSVRARSSSTTSAAPGSAAAARAVSRAASTTVRARSAASVRTMSRPISEVPPNSATDWTEPSASFIRPPGRVAVPGPIA